MEYLILTVALFLIYFALNELQSAESFFEVASMGAAGNDERGFVVSSQTFLQQMDEFRISKGICCASSMGVLMANPRVDNDKLISFASSKLSPSTYDFEIFSLLAKSTKFSIPCHSLPVRFSVTPLK